MESHVGAMGIIKESEGAFRRGGGSASLHSFGRPVVLLFDRVLLLIKAVTEYAFGICVGAAVGWLVGWQTGNVYVERFEPIHFSDFSELDQIIATWSLMPYDFARIGRLIGVAAGVVAIAIANSSFFTKRVISAYENGVIDPERIARLLGRSVRQVERRTNRLAKAGKIRNEKILFPERTLSHADNTL
jgi:hypothetical protein